MDFFKNMSTQKLIVICVVAIVLLNVLQEESRKNFEKRVLVAINNNSENARLALAGRLPVEEVKKNDNEVAKNPEPAPPQPAQPQEPSAEEQLKQQLADKVNVDIGNTPVLGSTNAKIMIVVFSDFQCPFSKRGAATIQALRSKYGSSLSFVHKNLPLNFHPQAEPAAKAVIAAGRQGKFYEYHDKLYENQANLSEEMFLQIAKDLGLNVEKFNTDRSSQEVASEVESDKSQASKFGFNGTPGFTVNGVKVLGAYPQEHFEKIISELGLG